MCVFQACNDDEDEIGSIIEGKIFTRTYNTGGESGEDGWRASITETLFFKANGVVLYKYVCQKTWWSPDDVGADTYNKSHQGTYTEKGNTIVVSGIPSSSDTDGWYWPISGTYIYSANDETLSITFRADWDGKNKTYVYHRSVDF